MERSRKRLDLFVVNFSSRGSKEEQSVFPFLFFPTIWVDSRDGFLSLGDSFDSKLVF